MNDAFIALYCVLLYHPQPPLVCRIHLDDVTAATVLQCQCAHHTPPTGGEKRESKCQLLFLLSTNLSIIFSISRLIYQLFLN